MSTTISLDIPTEHPSFPAHFPGNPIVPGALLLQWIQKTLKQHQPELTICRLRTVKFLDVVKPGDNCQLSIEANSESTQLKISCLCNGTQALKAVADVRRDG